jgi:diguanylate cyclase (GGDEF)-like protein
MKPLRVRDALCACRKIVRVGSEERPRPSRNTSTLYAVFSEDEEGRAGEFLGLVTEKEIALFPLRIFGDLVNRHAPPPVPEDTLLSKLQPEWERSELFLLPVVDAQGRFIGVVTLESMLRALLGREKTLLAESRQVNQLLEEDRAQLATWSARLGELQQASRTLMGLLAHSTLHSDLLQVGIEALVKLLNARYGAIGILDGGDGLGQFVYTGLSMEQAAKIDHFPEGKGLLGVVIEDNAALRLDDLCADPRCVGFPPNHPAMRSLLAVPISHLGQVYGRIYVCDKLDGLFFSAEDEALALSFAHSLSLVLDNAREIEEIQHAKKHLDLMAHYDGLTGLPNRELFSERLQQAIIQARRNHSQVGLLFLDVDNFKLINDTLGHPTGDVLLRDIAERLRLCVREGDTISRLGGDEFTLMLPGLASAEDAALVAQKVRDVLAQPMALGEHETVVSASIGIAVYPADGTDIDDLLKNADTAMYHAKARGRNNYQFYTEAMNVHAHERLTLEKHLRRALPSDEMCLRYQPQIEIGSRRIVGVEALLRWTCAQLGPMPPERFIPLAEETGLILPIGTWVLHTACAQAKAWIDRGLALPRIAVNISPRQFMQKDFFPQVAQILEETGLPADRLELEITETILMHHSDAVADLLRQLSGLGVHFSIDDFGTGYSSLSYLKRFPIGTLKIDQSFVRDLATDSCSAIVTAIIALAGSLKLDTVAEGVETPAQLQFLKERGCRAAQGFLLGPPLLAEDFERLLAAGGESAPPARGP